MSAPCNTYELNQAFLDALEFMDNVIKDRSFKQKRLYFDMIKRGPYPLGEGLVKKMHKFYTEIVDQDSLTNWRSIQISRPAAGADPGYDSCKYEAERVNYAFETIQYSGFETTKRSNDICLNDIKWKWEFEQQVDLIFSGLADTTLRVWENFQREMYLKMAGDASQIFVHAQGAPNGNPLSSTYNPFNSSDMVIPTDLSISTLQWSFMDYWYQHLNIQAPMSAIAQNDGMPVWGLVIHSKDLDWMIRNDSDVREDFRYGRPNVLLDQYGKVKEYKGFAIMHDECAPRFRVKAGGIGASTLTLERVNPYTTESTTVGSKPVINPDYVTAEYALGVIFLNDVYTTLVPPAGPAKPGGGTDFGAVPSLNGEFQWLNIQDRCENLLKEKGFYFGRFQAFAKPGEYHDDAIVFLYKRCPQTPAVLCEPCENTSASGSWATITAASPVIDSGSGESATSHTKVSITLGTCLPCEAPAEISVDYSGGTVEDVEGTIIDDSNAPTYIVGFQSAADYVDPATIVAGTSTVVCK